MGSAPGTTAGRVDWAAAGLTTLMTVLRIAAVVVVTHLAIVATSRLIDRLVTRKADRAGFDQRRLQTLATLAKSAVRYGLGFFAAMTALGFLGLDTSSLLLGAGVAGLAVGFGAQSLVRDVLTGFFILLENQFAVGDHVSLDGIEGVVDELGLRTTRVRAFGGEVHILPNGSITRVTNFSRGTIRVLFEVEVPYEENTGRAIDVVQQALDRYRETSAVVTEGPKVLGVSRLGRTGVSLMIWARVKPMEHWAVERDLKRKVKEALDEGGIQFPHLRGLVPARGRPTAKGSGSGQETALRRGTQTPEAGE